MNQARSRATRSGLGMVEALISLAISALLLTGAAVAFNASAQSVSDNDAFFKASQAARVSLARILTEIRRGSVDENSTVTSLHLITESNQDITYSYDSANQQVLLITNADTTDPDYVLARNVSQCQFLIELGTDSNNAQCVSRISIEIGVQAADATVRLCGSAAPRRNLVD